MPCQRLGHFGRHFCLAEVCDECMPQPVEIGKFSFAVFVHQKIRRFPFLLFRRTIRLVNPATTGCREVGL